MMAGDWYAQRMNLWAPRLFGRKGFDKSVALDGARMLDVGSGGRSVAGAVRMDVLALPGVDVVHDMNRVPWPFGNEQFDLVLLNNALEHADAIIPVLDEVHRILAPTGRAVIQVPYFRSVDAFADPTHRHFFTSASLDPVIAERQHYNYTEHLYTLKGFWYGWPHPSANPFARAIKLFAHRFPRVYDQYLSLIVPVPCLTWELEKRT